MSDKDDYWNSRKNVKTNGRAIVFNHIPKTGGTAIKSTISRYDLPLRASMGHKKPGIEKGVVYFMVSRHPYDRAVSDYRMKMGASIAKRDGTCGSSNPSMTNMVGQQEDCLPLGGLPDDFHTYSFKDYLKGIKTGKVRTEHDKTQKSYTNGREEVLVYEKGLGKEWDRFCLKYMGNTYPIETQRVSLKEIEVPPPDAETRRLVNEIYKDDFDYFNYGYLDGT